MFAIWGKIKNFLIKPEIYEEAAIAYFNRLPAEIQVEWFRDGKFIVGKIDVEGNKFLTQALSAKEFVEMVNDALFAVYDIPKEYFGILKIRRLMPSREEFLKLNNAAIKESVISFQKCFVPA